MSGFRGVMKDGWHPKGKEGGKESWRGDFKGINQVAGWVGKGKDPKADDRSEHVSRPLSSLKDPSTFGPPPKRGGGTVTGTGYGAAPSAGSPLRTTPRRGLGAPLAPEEIPQQPDQQDEQSEEPAAPPLPYRANRTGLNTDRLPPPPVRRTEIPINSTPAAAASQSRPNLPPRLPARNAPSDSPSPPPPPYSESDSSLQLNQGSVSRLENAGVSVPALGIGRRDSDQSVTAQRSMNNQVNELQSRFAKMSTPGSQSPSERVASGASSTEQLPYSRTEQNTYKNGNYSPVSRTDTRSARPVPPTNNYRQRSNEHIETGKQKLAAFNQKHKITERIHSYFEERPAEGSPQQGGQAPPPPPHPNLSRQSSNIDMEVLNRRKAPPPPPPAKKASLKSTPVSSNNSNSNSNNNNSGSAPPPLPLGTKPR